MKTYVMVKFKIEDWEGFVITNHDSALKKINSLTPQLFNLDDINSVYVTKEMFQIIELDLEDILSLHKLFGLNNISIIDLHYGNFPSAIWHLLGEEHAIQNSQT